MDRYLGGEGSAGRILSWTIKGWLGGCAGRAGRGNVQLLSSISSDSEPDSSDDEVWSSESSGSDGVLWCLKKVV